MGNVVSPCFQQNPNSSGVRVIISQAALAGRNTCRLLKGKHVAGEIMFEFPDHMVCHADSFFIGQPMPALSINDELMLGHTYFVLPLDRFSGTVLSTSSLAGLNSSSSSSSPNNRSPIKFGESPFEYIKGSNGKVLIKVVPEFIMRLITRVEVDQESGNHHRFLCSTPELRKHYEQLVGSKEQLWSPKLQTISEHNNNNNNKVRFSPCRFIGLHEYYSKPSNY